MLGKPSLKRFNYALIGLALISASSILHAETLTEVVGYVAKTNPKVLAAKQNRLSIDQAIRQARAGYYPHIKASASYGPDTSRNSNTIIAVTNGGNATTVTMPVARLGVTLDQMVFDGFATGGEVARHTERANSAAYQVRAAIEDAAFSVAQAYLDILKGQELVALAKKNVKEHQRISGMIGERTQRGLATNADSQQSIGRLALAQSTLLTEEYNLNDAIARYHLIVGDDPHGELREPDIAENYIPHSEESALELAQRNNPVVLSARADIQQAIAQRDVAKGPNYPRLDIQAGWDRNRNEGGVRGPDYDQFVFAKVSYDIFAGGAIVGRQQETVHLTNQAKEIMYNSARQAREETKLAWTNLQITRQALPYLKTHQRDASKVVGAYHEQYTLSKRSLLDLLDVQNESYNAQHAYIDGKYKILLSEVQLFHGMGTLTDALHVPMPVETCLTKSCNVYF